MEWRQEDALHFVASGRHGTYRTSEWRMPWGSEFTINLFGRQTARHSVRGRFKTLAEAKAVAEQHESQETP